MLDIEHLIKIKDIPRAFPQNKLLYFLRRIWNAVEKEPENLQVVFDETTIPASWFLKKWYKMGHSFKICPLGTFRRNSLIDNIFGYESYFETSGFNEDGGTQIIPDVLETMIEQPMLLKIESYDLAPADFDQIDVLNSLVTCRKLGDFHNRGVRDRGFAGFYVSVNEDNTMVVYQASFDANEDEVIWIIPSQEKKEWEW